MRLLPYGDCAVLVEVDENVDLLQLCESVAGEAGVVEAASAARTMLVEFDPARTSIERLESSLVPAAAAPMPTPTTPTPPISATPGPTPPNLAAPIPAGGAAVVDIDVRYDGADLAEVANELDVSVEELIRRHAAPTYVVAFCGFAPGFAYLAGLDQGLQVRRLAQPRASVPAGSIGIAGEFTGVYPSSSPGGWRLLGRTTAILWDSSRSAPALLAPGTAVRFTIT
jgi:KipI family sensor histidine kinase inhibitor